MYDITEKLDAAGLPVQLILICGRNEELAMKIRARHEITGPRYWLHERSSQADACSGFSDRQAGSRQHRRSHGRQLPVLIECNAWTLPQERYNAEWVKEKGVGIVLKSFDDITDGVKRMLDPRTLGVFRRNVAAQENRAVFEIPEILAMLLGEPSSEHPAFHRRRWQPTLSDLSRRGTNQLKLTT